MIGLLYSYAHARYADHLARIHGHPITIYLAGANRIRPQDADTIRRINGTTSRTPRPGASTLDGTQQPVR